MERVDPGSKSARWPVSERTSQLVGLVGFIVAGLIFIAVGVRSDDGLTIVGSVVWIGACLVWMAPLLRSDE